MWDDQFQEEQQESVGEAGFRAKHSMPGSEQRHSSKQKLPGIVTVMK